MNDRYHNQPIRFAPVSRRALVVGGVALAASGALSRVNAQSTLVEFPPFPELDPLPEIAERAEGPLKITATTGIIGDLVTQIGGGRIDLHTILPANADPHSFEPAPRDIAGVDGSAVIFVHGLGLDAWSATIIENAGGEFAVITVTDGIAAVERGEDDHDDDDHDDDDDGDDHDDDGHDDDEHDDHGHDHGHGVDPHVWFDPTKTAQMAANIAAALTDADPDGADGYAARLAAYREQLDALDRQIFERIALVPEENRKIVTNHEALGYYADRYGLTIVGTVIPGLSADAEPSAREIAALLETIEREGVTVIFAENTISPRLAQELADQTGISVVDTLYTDSLGEPGSDADTYIGLMRFNTRAIVEALLGL